MVRLFLISITSLLLLGHVAHADSAEARRHYDRGTKAFNLQDFKSALREFQAAYNEQPDAAFLFNIAQAERQLGEYDVASKSYRLFLANQPNAPNREQVMRLIDEMDKAAAEAHAKTPPTGTEPPTGNVTPPQNVPPPPPPVAIVDNGKSLRTAGFVAGGVGVAGLALGIAFAVLSKQAGDDAYHPKSGIYDHAADLRQTNFRNADIACFVVGGAAAVVGTTLWLLGHKRAASTQAALSPASGGFAVSF